MKNKNLKKILFYSRVSYFFNVKTVSVGYISMTVLGVDFRYLIKFIIFIVVCSRCIYLFFYSFFSFFFVLSWMFSEYNHVYFNSLAIKIAVWFINLN